MIRRLLACAATLVCAAALLPTLPASATVAHAPPSAATPKACVVAGCWVTAHVDVDGDGRADTVSSTRTHPGPHPVWTVRVLTATKKLASVSYTYEDVGLISAPGNVWFGAGAIDGVKGADLVIGGWTADARWYRVFTWRAGRLVALAHPGGGADWGVSHDSNGSNGFTFGTNSKGARSVVVSTLYHEPTERYDGTLTRYAWSRTRWVRTSTATVNLSPTQAAKYAGWNGTALKKGLEGAGDRSCSSITFPTGAGQASDIFTTNVTCNATARFIQALEPRLTYQESAFTYGPYTCSLVAQSSGILAGCLYGTRWIGWVRTLT